MRSSTKTPPKPGTKGFLLEVLPTHECLNQAIDRNGFCDPRKCWHFVAINKKMEELDPGAKHHVRVDAGHIKLNYKGWRYVANTPRHVKHSLMLFDKKLYDHVRIRRYKLRFSKTTKIVPVSRERMDQINEARWARAAEGRPDKPSSTTNTIRKRVEGFSSIV